jgi:hypothetical protein
VSLSGALTAEQIRLFRHNGYLKLQDTLPADLVETFRLRSKDYILKVP